MGKTVSCGCARKRTSTNKHSWKGHGKVPGKYWAGIKRQKRQSVTITLKYIADLFDTQHERCALTGMPLSFTDTSASLDRIDSSKGYEPGNVWWVHKWVNRMKMDLPLAEFLDWCNKITTNRKYDRKSSSKGQQRRDRFEHRGSRSPRPTQSRAA